MRPLSEATARIAGKSFERKYIALGRIVKAWDQIVGEDMATKAQPVKINYRKRERSKKAQASLDIAVSSADATLLHYQKDLILERINQVFGEQWVSAIRFVHMPANNAAPKLGQRLKPLSPAEKKSLSELLLNIADPDIRERLEGLGTAVISKEKS
jgi:hypothetical protein